MTNPQEMNEVNQEEVNPTEQLNEEMETEGLEDSISSDRVENHYGPESNTN